MDGCRFREKEKRAIESIAPNVYFPCLLFLNPHILWLKN